MNIKILCRQTCVVLLIIVGLLEGGCKKYLDAKPDKALVIPSKVQDLQALLDNNQVMNTKDPGYGEASSDNYYLTTDGYYSLPYDEYRNLYLWKENNARDGSVSPWSYCYSPVYISNIVLESIENIERTSNEAYAWDNVKGSALFYRGRCFFNAVQTWAKAYDESSSSTDLGVPLRLNSNFNEKSVRHTVAECYNQIISDLKGSIPLLPDLPSHVMRPSKAGAYGMLARVYLSMRRYEQAKLYSDSCLMLKDDLMDYNAMSLTPSAPFTRTNPEIITYFAMLAAGTLTSTRYNVDSLLFSSYADSDLRKIGFFASRANGTYTFKGNYTSSGSTFFGGIATDEIYLTRAECNARLGKITEAMTDLNKLAKNRYDSTSFAPFDANSAEKALEIILSERRKELAFRDIRWMDIKRLNLEGYNISLTRIVDGQTYSLAPNDDRFALPIPLEVISMTGMPQN